MPELLKSNELFYSESTGFQFAKPFSIHKPSTRDLRGRSVIYTGNGFRMSYGKNLLKNPPANFSVHDYHYFFNQMKYDFPKAARQLYSIFIFLHEQANCLKEGENQALRIQKNRIGGNRETNFLSEIESTYKGIWSHRNGKFGVIFDYDEGLKYPGPVIIDSNSVTGVMSGVMLESFRLDEDRYTFALRLNPLTNFNGELSEETIYDQKYWATYQHAYKIGNGGIYNLSCKGHKSNLEPEKQVEIPKEKLTRAGGYTPALATFHLVKILD